VLGIEQNEDTDDQVAGVQADAADAPAVRQIKRDAAPTNYRFASLVQAIVRSTPFQMWMAQQRAN